MALENDGRASSRPGEAGLLTITLPVLSRTHSRPSRFAVSTTNAAAAASCFDGRGIFDISAK